MRDEDRGELEKRIKNLSEENDCDAFDAGRARVYLEYISDVIDEMRQDICPSQDGWDALISILEEHLEDSHRFSKRFAVNSVKKLRASIEKWLGKTMYDGDSR